MDTMKIQTSENIKVKKKTSSKSTFLKYEFQSLYKTNIDKNFTQKTLLQLIIKEKRKQDQR